MKKIGQGQKNAEQKNLHTTFMMPLFFLARHHAISAWSIELFYVKGTFTKYECKLKIMRRSNKSSNTVKNGE
jgi:hypothetical protein